MLGDVGHDDRVSLVARAGQLVALDDLLARLRKQHRERVRVEQHRNTSIAQSIGQLTGAVGAARSIATKVGSAVAEKPCP